MTDPTQGEPPQGHPGGYPQPPASAGRAAWPPPRPAYPPPAYADPAYAQRYPRQPAYPPFPHPQPVPYHLMHRTWTYAWWKPVVGIVALFIGFFLISPLVLLPIVLIGGGADRRATTSRTSWVRSRSTR